MQWDIVSLCSFVFTRAAILSHGNSELHDLHLCTKLSWFHYSDVITSTMASQITSLTIVYSIVYSGADQKKIKAPRHWSLCREFTSDLWLSPHRGPVTWQMFPFDDVIMLKKRKEKKLVNRGWMKSFSSSCVVFLFFFNWPCLTIYA